MVDASIGGKTGVNHPGGKNLIGAFHQPKLVLIDPQVLATLPEREFRAGMAEVIKYAVIGDDQLFNDLEQAAVRDPQGALASREAIGPELLQRLLERSAAAKARVVAADEREGGLRAILNYGHTLGHAVENLSGYGTCCTGKRWAWAWWPPVLSPWRWGSGARRIRTGSAGWWRPPDCPWAGRPSIPRPC
jgi:3-dehydroquinate synthase